jgi:hypothetical protein
MRVVPAFDELEHLHSHLSLGARPVASEEFALLRGAKAPTPSIRWSEWVMTAWIGAARALCSAHRAPFGPQVPGSSPIPPHVC